MPACEAANYLRMWDSDASLKPRGFDAATSLRLRGVADIAAVSAGGQRAGGRGRGGGREGVGWQRVQRRPHARSRGHGAPRRPPPAPTRADPLPPHARCAAGGRANGRWKPDNQDSFLVQPTASKHGGASSSSSDEEAGAGEPAAAAIGVFDGHGRLGGQAAAIVRQAMAERLAAMGPEDAAAAAAGGLAGAAALLDGCFTAADAALAQSGRDFSKSGCTAVLALLDRDRWAGGRAGRGCPLAL